MNWAAAPLRKIAPPIASKHRFEPDEKVWQLSLDQIESETGEIICKRYAAASEAGSSTFHFDQGNVLYSKLRPYLNKVALPEEPGVATTELIPLRPDPTILDLKFLAFYLRSPAFVNQASHHAGGAKMPRVSMDWFWEHKAPLPTPSEQSRIVELLDEADRLRRLRREADAKAARILPVLFLKMFGDPATNPMGWREGPLRDAISTIEPGWSAPSDQRRKGVDEIGVLKVSAVTSGRFLATENKAVTTDTGGRVLITARKGDLLFSRANTRELVAATCIVDVDHPDLFLSDKLWRISSMDNEATNVFLKALLSNGFVRDKIRTQASGSSGSMLNVSQEAVLRTIVPMPPIDLQKSFSNIAWQIIEHQSACQTTGERLDEVWGRLMNQAFSGQLTAKWRESHMHELLAEMEQQARALNSPIATEAFL